MKRILFIFFQYVIFLGLGIFLLWWTTRNLNDDQNTQLKNALRDANYLLVIPAMVMLLLSHYSRALRWKILMEPLNIRPSSINTFFAVMLSYFFNLLVPRLGEVMKCTLLARYEKTPVDKLLGTMVAERAIDMICLLIVMFITIFIQIETVGEFFKTEFRNAFTDDSGNLQLSGLIRFFLLAIAGVSLVLWLLKKFSHISIIGRINNLIRGVWQGLTSIRYVKRKGAFLFHTLFIWTMYFMSIRIGFYAMESVAHLGMKPSFTILTFGSVAMIITQGGIGAYQLAVQKTLTLYQIDEVNGLAYGWLLWAVQTLLVFIIGLICLFLLPVYNRRKNESSRKDQRQDIVA